MAKRPDDLYITHAVSETIAEQSPSENLITASRNGDCKRLHSLLQHRHVVASISQLHEDTTPLHEACRHGHPDCVKLLLERRADGRAKNKRGFAPIHVAAYNGHAEVIELLLDYNSCEVDLPSSKGETALQVASVRGFASTVNVLLTKHAKADTQDEDCNTALHYAAASSCPDAVKSLVNRLDVNFKNKYGKTPLHCAAELGSFECLQVLLQHNPDLCIKDQNGCTPLQLAIAGGNSKCAHVLHSPPTRGSR